MSVSRSTFLHYRAAITIHVILSFIFVRLCFADNYVHDMLDAGIAVMESFDSEIYDNEFKNVKYGIRFSVGSSNNYVHDNIFDNCSKCET